MGWRAEPLSFNHPPTPPQFVLDFCLHYVAAIIIGVAARDWDSTVPLSSISSKPMR